MALPTEPRFLPGNGHPTVGTATSTQHHWGRTCACTWRPCVRTCPHTRDACTSSMQGCPPGCATQAGGTHEPPGTSWDPPGFGHPAAGAGALVGPGGNRFRSLRGAFTRGEPGLCQCWSAVGAPRATCCRWVLAPSRWCQHKACVLRHTEPGAAPQCQPGGLAARCPLTRRSTGAVPGPAPPGPELYRGRAGRGPDLRGPKADGAGAEPASAPLRR